jgi:hypothetical protein
MTPIYSRGNVSQKCKESEKMAGATTAACGLVQPVIIYLTSTKLLSTDRIEDGSSAVFASCLVWDIGEQLRVSKRNNKYFDFLIIFSPALMTELSGFLHNTAS